jgi:hypothetical protein
VNKLINPTQSITKIANPAITDEMITKNVNSSINPIYSKPNPSKSKSADEKSIQKIPGIDLVNNSISSRLLYFDKLIN